MGSPGCLLLSDRRWTGPSQGGVQGCPRRRLQKALTLTSVSSQDVKQASHGEEGEGDPLSESHPGACVLCPSMRHNGGWTPGFLTALDQDFFFFKQFRYFLKIQQ